MTAAARLTLIRRRTLLPAEIYDGFFGIAEHEGRPIIVQRAGARGCDPDWWEYPRGTE